jgi:acetyltransferase-like isoleucine patch superfamily enzyme
VPFISTFKARLKGAQIGKKTILAPGYDWLLASWNGVSLGSRVLVGRRAWIQTTNKNARISIGHGCSIGRDVVISAADRIQVGEECLLSYRVSILDHDHKFIIGVSPVNSGIGTVMPVSIGARTFIGANVTILKGTRIGSDCIIGANSLVKGIFEDRSIIAGNPAQTIGIRNVEETRA